MEMSTDTLLGLGLVIAFFLFVMWRRGKLKDVVGWIKKKW